MSLNLAQVETLCERVYTSQNARERQEAEKLLGPLGENKDHILTCREILDKSRSPYALLFASTSFRKLVTEQEFSPQARLEMRNYVLGYLDRHVSFLEPFVVASLVRLVCRIVRLGWFEGPLQQDIVESCRKLMMSSVPIEQYLLGIQILNGLIVEMNTYTKKTGLVPPSSRQIALAFKEETLLPIFELSLQFLRQIKDIQNDSRFTLIEESLKLAVACLSYDFSGSGNDASDEPGSIQIPAPWKSVVEDPALIEMCLQLYSSDKMSISRLAMEFLVGLASVRRTIFNLEPDRRKFVERLVSTTLTILKGNLNLQDIQNYNEFCKFLGRIKSNFNMQDLVNASNYNDWIEAVASFTIDSLNQWRCASGSIVHLLNLWSRMVTSMAYVKTDSTVVSFDSKIPTIVNAYINSRLECVMGAKNGVIEDPLEDEGKMQEQLETLPQLCRFKYTQTHDVLVQIMDPLIQQLVQLTTQPPDPNAFAVVEGKLTWMVYISASIIKGRPPSPSEECDAQDQSLAGKVFNIIRILQEGNHQRRGAEVSRQRLDLAIISFMDSFRSSYIIEHRLQASRLFLEAYEKDKREAGTAVSEQIVSTIVDKITWNLQFYPTVPSLINSSLKLFWDVTTAFSHSKTILKLETVKKMLSGCSSEFTFLKEPANFRNRTLFYAIVGRLLFLDEITFTKFQSFVTPLHHVLEGLKQCQTVESLRSNVPAETVIGVFRDLRGIVESATSNDNYTHVFSFLHPQYFPVILKCVEAWADRPEVTTPILKFMAEFALNKASRISFNVRSANGILLFKQVSQVILLYGTQVMKFPKDGNQYQIRYKGIWICFMMFMRALVGNYANYGVFELYRDPCLANALEVTFKMMIMLPTSDIFAYRKLLKAYFPLMDILLAHHATNVVQLDFQSFRTLISTLEAGLKSQDGNTCSQCASAIDHLATYYYHNVVEPQGVVSLSESAKSLERHIQAWPTLFPSLLRILMEIVFLDEATAMWSMSRPILALIVINAAWFTQIKEEMMASQSEEQREYLNGCFVKLMEDVERNLKSKNRDKFTSNLSSLKNDIKTKR